MIQFRYTLVAAAQALALVASACGNSSEPPGAFHTPPTSVPSPAASASPQASPATIVLSVTAGDPSGSKPLTVQVGTIVKVHLLEGNQRVDNWQSPSVADPTVLQVQVSGGDTITNGFASQYVAVRRGRTTISVVVKSTSVTFDVTVV